MPHRSRTKRPPAGSTATTRREETPALEGREPLPEELTGRASGTGEDLTALFEDDSVDHLNDGFRGGSADDRETDLQKSDSAPLEPAIDTDDDAETGEAEVSP